jgi:hypothetical protein
VGGGLNWFRGEVVVSYIEIYANCMARIRDRINVVQTIMSGGLKVGLADQN